MLLHRAAYELYVGPIPDGLDLDHVYDRGCRSRRCCNPAHLEPVTRQENILRRTRRITHCPKGHEYSESNTRLRPSASGGINRQCRVCEAARSREYAKANSETVNAKARARRAKKREQD